MSWPPYRLHTTATVSCVYAAGMLLSIGSLYLVPSVFDYRGPAREAYEAGDFAAAAEYYGRIVALRPMDSEAHFFRGQSLGFRGDLHGALASIDAALEIAPRAAPALTGKTLLLLHLSRFQEAVDVAAQLRSDESHYLFVQYAVVRHLIASGELEQAEAMLRQALAVDSEWAPGYLSLGCVLNRSGRPRQALEALGRARALDPTIDVDYASLWLEDPFPDWPMRDDATIPARICREE